MSTEGPFGNASEGSAPAPVDRGAPPSERGNSGRTSRTLWIGCLMGVVGGFTVLVLLVGAFIVLLVALSAMATSSPAPGRIQIQEFHVGGKRGEAKVAVIPVRGILLREGGTITRDPLAMLEAMLEKARKDEQVNGVILSVDSGGGGMTTCDMMRDRLLNFREETGYPVVVLMGDVAASGAYYISCVGDYLVAHPTSLTGSIGVVFPFYDASGLLEKVGVEDRSVKSGKFKELGSPFAERSPEQWKAEKELLSDIIQQMHDRFVQVVAEGRGIGPDAVRELADGRIFTARGAEENNLVDSIGYQQDAVEKVKELAGLKEVHVVEYTRRPTLKDVLLGLGRGRVVNVQLRGAPTSEGHRRPMYLWQPAVR